MKIIKINPDHYIIVDDSEIIKEGDWIYSFDNELILQANKGSVDTISSKSFNGKGFAKITHSTQPLNDNPHYADYGIITLREVKELIGEVDVIKRKDEYLKKVKEEVKDYEQHDRIYILGTSDLAFTEGYNQALEDNKDKKYTEADMKECVKSILRDLNTHNEIDKPVNFVWTDSFKKHIQSLQPKTEWEVEFDEQGKLKLV